jgi:hypothetical protein
MHVNTMMYATLLGLGLAVTPAQAQDLWVSPLVGGQAATFETVGLSGAAYLAYSVAGASAGAFCPPALGGACVDMNSPGVVGTTTGATSVPLPGLVGTEVWFQTIEAGLGGSNVVSGVIGGDLWEVGSTSETFSGGGRWRGNAFTVNTDSVLYDVGMYLEVNTPGGCFLTWQIYVNGTPSYQRDVSTVAGYGYHHGPISGGLRVRAGDSIMVGAGWDSSCNVTYGRTTSDVAGDTNGALTFNSWAYSDSWPATAPAPHPSLFRAYHQVVVTD